MFRSTIPAGRWLGVEFRLHMALPALLVVAGTASVLQTGQAARGLELWCALVAAILTREAARILTLVWNGLTPRTVILFPFGGVVALSSLTSSGAGSKAYTDRPSGDPAGGRPPDSRPSLTLVPLLANLSAALLLLGFSYAVAPGVNLFARPWISLHHILRSTVWIQIVIGAINLLPAAALPTRQLLRSRSVVRTLNARNAGPAFGLVNTAGLLLMLLGFVLLNLWFVTLGCFLLLGARMQNVQGPDLDQLATLPVRDVMLTNYTTLANSALLSEALETTEHNPQDVFPVLQGDMLVGSITRAAMSRRLHAEGDGYVQRDMERRLPLADPGERLREALHRATALSGSGEFVAVAEGGRVLGILTPGTLATALERRRTSSADWQPPPERMQAIATPEPPAVGETPRS